MPTSKSPFPSDAADKYVVRFPPGLRDEIAAAAKANNRSMNAEIVARLQAYGGKQSSLGGEDLTAVLAKLDEIEKLLHATSTKPTIRPKRV